MESSHSLCVLPSQGPPFSDEDEFFCESPQRALQLSSGNVGSIGSESTCDYLKIEVGDQNGQAGTPLFTTRTANLEGSLSRLGERRRRRQRRDGGRQYPWHRDRNFIRYELDSERYRAYRLKSRQNNDQVWPDDVEDCLQYALRVIPVLGRKKDARIDFNYQQGGRNELIRDFIKKWTGEERDRKQVSSHLQVLKGYLGMKLVTATKDDDSSKSNSRREYAYGHRHYSRALPPPTEILRSNAPPSVHQVDFEMYLADADTERLHTFTSIQSEIGSGPRPLEEVFEWRKAYPDLASFYRKGKTSAELILLETNIEPLREQPPPGSHLGINPFVVVAGGANFQDWILTTRLYEGGVWVRDRRKDIELDNYPQKLSSKVIEGSSHVKVILSMKSSWWAHNVIAEMLRRTTAARAQGNQRDIYEAEQWGRRFLAGMSMMQEIWATPRNGDTPQMIAIMLWQFRQTKHSETATTTWRKLTPPFPRTHTHSPDPSLDLGLLQQPTPPDTRLQGEVGSHFEPAIEGCLGPSSLFVDDPESIITSQLSGAISTSSTPTPDLQSLPSSTATSFASSGSGSFHHIHDRADSFSVVEEPRYLPQDWEVHSQESFYSMQDSIHRPQDMAYERRNSQYPDPSEVYATHPPDTVGVVRYHGQEVNDATESLPLFSRHCSSQGQYSITEQNPYGSQDHRGEVVPPNFDHQGESPLSQDFTGGQIHISFAEDEHRQQQTYSHPLIAPQADMLLSQRQNHHHEVGETTHPNLETSNNTFEFERQPTHYSASQDLEDLSPSTAMDLIPQHPFPLDHTIDHPQSHTSPILHHPQPHQSLAHHLDSAQWQTHALWANIHGHIEDEDEFEDIGPPALDAEMGSKHERGLDGSVGQELEEQEQGQGHVIGEISPALERGIDDIERDMAREMRKEMCDVELQE